MEWNVKNALSRNTEREHLNKILADIKKTIESKTSTSAAPVVQSTVPVVAKPRDLTITLTGPVTGQGKGVTGISIATSLSEEVVMDAPKDGNFYWRFSGKWLPVPAAVLALNYIEGSGLLAWNFDDGEFNVRNIEGTPGQIDVDNGDGYAANPTISLAALDDEGGGSFKLIERDSFGRVAGTSDGTTDDVPEGSTNLYYTDARADARVLYGLQQNTTATYTDAYGITHTLSISRASDFDDGGIRYVSGSFTATAVFSSTEAYRSEYSGAGLYSYKYDPSQSGSYYTTYGITNSGNLLSFLNASIDKSTKAFHGTRFLTLVPSGIPDPSSGGYEQKAINVPYENGTVALLSDLDSVQKPAPLVVATGTIYKVLTNNQIPFMYPITIEGTGSIVIDGALIGIT